VRPAGQGWLPWRALAVPGVALLLLQAVLEFTGVPAGAGVQWAGAIGAAVLIIGANWWASADLRAALAR
jgi:hypothetical protein